MNKYFLILKNNMQRSLVYRFNTFAVLAVQIVSFLMFFYLWSSIYKDGQRVGDYNLNGITTYYLLVIFLGVIIKSNDIAWKVGDEIRFGAVTNYLLKPMSYFWDKIFGALGDVIYKFLIYIGSILFIFLFFKNYLTPINNTEQIIYFLALVFIGLILYLVFFYIIGISAFWFGFIFGFNSSMHMIVNFLSGSMIPLDLLPEVIQKINNFLPFKYMLYVPIQVFTGKLDATPHIIIIPLLWIILLYIIATIIFKYGIKKYEGYGA